MFTEQQIATLADALHEQRPAVQRGPEHLGAWHQWLADVDAIARVCAGLTPGLMGRPLGGLTFDFAEFRKACGVPD